MKSLKSYIQEALKVRSTSKVNEYNYHPKTKNELKDLIGKLIKERGNEADLNDIDTSDITDMSSLFDSSKFNGDISKWNVNNVITMSNMFYNSLFTGENGDISNWNVSNVENISWMFCDSKFNGDISKWDVRNVKKMNMIFRNSPLEKNPPKWYK